VVREDALRGKAYLFFLLPGIVVCFRICHGPGADFICFPGSIRCWPSGGWP
jgi:hypothetical protein